MHVSSKCYPASRRIRLGNFAHCDRVNFERSRLDAWQAYRPSRWPGRLTLLRGTVRPNRIGVSYDDPANGWGEFADEIDVLPVNTDHLAFFIEPAVQQTAAELSKALRAANAKSD